MARLRTIHMKPHRPLAAAGQDSDSMTDIKAAGSTLLWWCRHGRAMGACTCTTPLRCRRRISTRWCVRPSSATKPSAWSRAGCSGSWARSWACVPRRSTTCTWRADMASAAASPCRPSTCAASRTTRRARFSARAKTLDAGAFILEIARSEIAYTEQRPAEYVSVHASRPRCAKATRARCSSRATTSRSTTRSTPSIRSPK